ncbi:MAG TPA: hypothetical protein VF508_12565 [Pyrinomonadaceae bacterium]
MNKKTKALTVFVALAAALCVGAARPASADQEGFVRTQVRIDVPPEILHNDCTGEDILVTGFLHQMFFYHVDGGGGGSVYRSSGIHDIQHSNGQGLSAVGVETGKAYRVQIVNNSSLHTDFYSPIAEVQDFANSFTHRVEVIFTAPGANNNFRSTLLVHITVNANGEVTTVVENLSGIECL